VATLRERKRERTRQAIVDAALALFAERGYEGTTVADIAAAADIGTRTFFGYFASKEELVLPPADARVGAALAAIRDRAPGEAPMDVLLRALDAVVDAGHDFSDEGTRLRTQVIREVPAVRGRALELQMQAQREIAEHLEGAFAELDPVTAGALVGAFVGAISGAAEALGRGGPADPAERKVLLRRAVETALRPR
jgi:AcrR family transcriptional regulator